MAGVAEIKVNQRQLRSLQKMLGGSHDAMSRITVRSVNRTVIGVRATAVKEFRTDAPLKAARIRKGTKLKKARSTRPVATVSFDPHRIGLINFQGRKIKKGVSYKVRSGGPRTQIKGAWIMTSNGAKGIFKRFEDERVRMLFGPSIGKVIENPNILSQLIIQSEARLERELDSQVALYLSRRGGFN